MHWADDCFVKIKSYGNGLSDCSKTDLPIMVCRLLNKALQIRIENAGSLLKTTGPYNC